MSKKSNDRDLENEFDRIRFDTLVDAVADLVASVSNLGDKVERLEEEIEQLRQWKVDKPYER